MPQSSDPQHIKALLNRELDAIKEQLRDANERNDEKIERLEKEIYVLKVIVAGNGDPSKSLVIRFDRIEQTAKRRQWLLHAALGSSISAIVGIIAMAVKHFLSP